MRAVLPLLLLALFWLSICSIRRKESETTKFFCFVAYKSFVFYWNKKRLSSLHYIILKTKCLRTGCVPTTHMQKEVCVKMKKEEEIESKLQKDWQRKQIYKNFLTYFQLIVCNSLYVRHFFIFSLGCVVFMFYLR